MCYLGRSASAVKVKNTTTTPHGDDRIAGHVLSTRSTLLKYGNPPGLTHFEHKIGSTKMGSEHDGDAASASAGTKRPLEDTNTMSGVDSSNSSTEPADFIALPFYGEHKKAVSACSFAPTAAKGAVPVLPMHRPYAPAPVPTAPSSCGS